MVVEHYGLRTGLVSTVRFPLPSTPPCSLSPDAHLRLEILGSIGVLERVDRLLELAVGWRDVRDHHRAAVAPEG
eukprot:scaffold35134_cov112-Isochrysis_galbana.AAC.1